MKVFVASSNAGKLRDFATAAKEIGVEILLVPGLITIPPVEEDAPNFEGNARKKAEYYSRFAHGEIVLADDSGLEVTALEGAPGVHSARYAAGPQNPNSSDEDNNQKLLLELGKTNASDRSARYVCILALARDGKTIATFAGEAKGEILEQGRGCGGFGYDPLFYFPEKKKTFAELTAEERIELGHRGAAVREFVKWMRKSRAVVS